MNERKYFNINDLNNEVKYLDYELEEFIDNNKV